MKNTFSLPLLIIFLFISLIAQAQVSTIFNGVKFGESLDDTEEKLKPISDNLRKIKIVTPSFPLAKSKEEHLIATTVNLNDEIIDNVVFTFADDKLCFIQANGNVIAGLTSNIKSEAKTYLDYQAYIADLLFIHKEKDVAWLLTPESVHPNLFTWNNPYLTANNTKEITYNPSVKIPDFVKMGENIEVLTPLLKNNSAFIHIEELDSDTNTQINCFGIEYGGFPRKFEARFENDKLNMVWILTGKGEENRIRKKLTEAYGNAEFINEQWEVFNNWTVILRKDKPEVLLLEQELGLMYKKQFSN